MHRRHRHCPRCQSRCPRWLAQEQVPTEAPTEAGARPSPIDVPSKPCGACQRGHDTIGRDLADGVIPRIKDVQIACTVNAQTSREKEPCSNPDPICVARCSSTSGKRGDVCSRSDLSNRMVSRVSVTYRLPPSTAMSNGWLNRAPTPNPSSLPIAEKVPAIVVTTASGVILRMLLSSTIYRLFILSTATPLGHLKCAAVPIPSMVPNCSPTEPASVVTTASGVIFRTVELPASTTYRLPPLSVAIPR